MFNIGDEVRVIKSESLHHNGDVGHIGIISAMRPSINYEYEVNFGYTIRGYTHKGIHISEPYREHYRYYYSWQLELIADDICDIDTDEIMVLLTGESE